MGRPPVRCVIYRWTTNYRCREGRFWSEPSACAAWVALQTGCQANIMATKFIAFLLSFSLLVRLITFSDLDLI